MLAHTLLSAVAHQHGAFTGPTSDDLGDVVRIFDIIAGIAACAGLSVVALARVSEHRWSSVLLMVALATFLVSSVGTEWQVLGQVVTWRLYVNTAATLLALVALGRWIAEVRRGYWNDTITPYGAKQAARNR